MAGYSERRAAQLSVKGIDQEYTLVSFEDECCISVVPSKKVRTDNGLPPKEGDVVGVQWEGKRLCATFLMTGSHQSCKMMQSSIEDGEDGEDSNDAETNKENTEPCMEKAAAPTRKRKRKLIPKKKDQKTVTEKKKCSKKTNKKENDDRKKTDDDFIVYVGAVPPREDERDKVPPKDNDGRGKVPPKEDDDGGKVLPKEDDCRGKVQPKEDDDCGKHNDRGKVPPRENDDKPPREEDDGDNMLVREEDGRGNGTEGLHYFDDYFDNGLSSDYHTDDTFNSTKELVISLESDDSDEKRSRNLVPTHNFEKHRMITESEFERLNNKIEDVAKSVYMHHQFQDFQLGELSQKVTFVTTELLSIRRKMIGMTSSSAENVFPEPTVEIDGGSSCSGQTSQIQDAVTGSKKKDEVDHSTKEQSNGGELLSSGDLTQVFLKSCSRPNFAKRLCTKLFPEEVRKVSNVAGGKKKQQLCPTTIEYIKKQCFLYWPLQPDERKEKDEWASCIIAIDEGNRRLNRVTKVTTNPTKPNEKK